MPRLGAGVVESRERTAGLDLDARPECGHAVRGAFRSPPALSPVRLTFSHRKMCAALFPPRGASRCPVLPSLAGANRPTGDSGEADRCPYLAQPHCSR